MRRREPSLSLPHDLDATAKPRRGGDQERIECTVTVTSGRDDGVSALAPIRDRFPEFADLLAAEPEDDLFDALRSAESIGRPLRGSRFLARLERQTVRVLKPAKRGPKPSVDGIWCTRTEIKGAVLGHGCSRDGAEANAVARRMLNRLSSS